VLEWKRRLGTETVGIGRLRDRPGCLFGLTALSRATAEEIAARIYAGIDLRPRAAMNVSALSQDAIGSELRTDGTAHLAAGAEVVVDSVENVETRARVRDTRGGIDRARNRCSADRGRRRARGNRRIGARGRAGATWAIERRRLSDRGAQTN